MEGREREGEGREGWRGRELEGGERGRGRGEGKEEEGGKVWYSRGLGAVIKRKSEGGRD